MNNPKNPASSDRFIIIFDCDGNLIDGVEEIASEVYYQLLYDLLAPYPPAQKRLMAKLAPENGGHKWFAEHLTGSIHQKFIDILNQEIMAPDFLWTTKASEPLIAQGGPLIAKRLSSANLMRGTTEMLTKLRQDSQIVMYILSGATSVRLNKELSNTGIQSFFSPENVLGKETFLTKADAIEKIMAKEQASKEHIILTGDSMGEIRAARLTAAGPVYIISNLGGSHCFPAYQDEIKAAKPDKIVYGNFEMYEAIKARMQYIRRQER